VLEHPEAFDHIGLLANGPPDQAGLPFIKSSDNSRSDSAAALAGTERLNFTSDYALCEPKKASEKFTAFLYVGCVLARFAATLARQQDGGEHLRRPPAPRVVGEVTMKTHGEIEAAICEGISHFEQNYMGRGPKDIRAHLIGDLLVVRLQGVLTAAEQHLAKSLPAEKGRDLLKQVRTHLVETARPILEAMVREITGMKVLSLHHDISTVTGEEIVMFTLAEPVLLRESKKK
jgi:uncharacterized protein YbcI